MKKQDIKAFNMMISVSKAIYDTDTLLNGSKNLVEQAAKSVEQMVAKSQDISLIMQYAVLVLGETMFWLPTKEQIEKERFICQYLPTLSHSQKRDLLDSIRDHARWLYPDDVARQLSISFHAKDLLFDSFPIMRRR